MPYITAEVEVDVNLSDFDTADLVEELENRGHMADTTSKEIVEAIYQKRRNDKDYQAELDSLIFSVLGKIV